MAFSSENYITHFSVWDNCYSNEIRVWCATENDFSEVSVKVSFHRVCEVFNDYIIALGVGFRDRCAGTYYILFSKCFWSKFLGFVLFLEPRYRGKCFDRRLRSGMFRFTVHNYRSIAIDMLENSDLMEKINFRKWSALMRVKFCSFMMKTKQTLLNWWNVRLVYIRVSFNEESQRRDSCMLLANNNC